MPKRNIAGSVFAFVLLLIFVLYKTLPDEKERFTIVLATSPVGVLTLDTVTKTGMLLLIPESTVIDAARATGRYPIGSLWKMGEIDGSDRPLLGESISVALGIPVDGYIGRVSGSLDSVSDSSNLVQTYFSFASLASTIMSPQKTNLSYRDALSIYRILKTVNAHDIRVVKLENLMATFDEQLPDDSVRKVLDTQKLDVLLKNEYIIQSVRKEALSIGLLNTTKVPDLAGKIARQLTNSGIYVVSIDNSDPALGVCQIIGSQKALESETSHFFRQIYHCTTMQSDVPSREDLIMKIGSESARLYLPR